MADSQEHVGSHAHLCRCHQSRFTCSLGGCQPRTSRSLTGSRNSPRWLPAAGAATACTVPEEGRTQASRLGGKLKGHRCSFSCQTPGQGWGPPCDGNAMRGHHPWREVGYRWRCPLGAGAEAPSPQALGENVFCLDCTGLI